ncbi:MAG: nucleotidyltransferase domain-containing protein [Acidimicrobiales bacterium]
MGPQTQAAEAARLAPALYREVGELLLWALQGSPDRESMPALRPAASIPLVEVAHRHGIAAIVHDALARAGALGALGPPARLGLSDLRLQCAAQHLRLSAELAALSATLDGAGIAWAIMKGPAVAALGYAEPNQRYFVDLDILVPASKLGPAIDVICQAGATLLDVNWELQAELGRSEVGLMLPLGTPLDLHWHPVNDRSARATTSLDVGAMLARRRMAAIGGAQRPVLDPADNVLLVALHAALSSGYRLTWSKDLQCLARRHPPDWDLLVERAAEAGAALPVGLMLRRAVRLLGAPVPPGAIAALLGGEPGASLLRWGESLATPTALARGTHTGRLLVSSLRASWPASAGALVKAAQGYLIATLQAKGATLGHGQRPSPAQVANPLRTPAGGSLARARYLAAINQCAEAGAARKRAARR